ncbi:hypothetical protein ACKI2N_005190 [Cupriavidus sp. 30B13]|uniref:hypothetical protein n=1 Tax=Cupriavidus sp. 30B13 TaxID=3384241 RepID=UPI003B91BC31
MSKHKGRSPRPRTDNTDMERSEEAQAGIESIPSTLDPRLDAEAADIENELDESARQSHEPPPDEVPEEDMGEVERAAESLPADTPVDRADQTDQREEHPPSRP